MIPVLAGTFPRSRAFYWLDEQHRSDLHRQKHNNATTVSIAISPARPWPLRLPVVKYCRRRGDDNDDVVIAITTTIVTAIIIKNSENTALSSE